MRIFALPVALLFACTVFFSSCMISFNERTHRMTIATNRDTGKIWVDKEPFFLEKGETVIKVERDKGPLIIQLQPGDSAPKIIVRGHNSFNYLYDAVGTAGLSALVSRDNPKRYYFQKNIYLEQRSDTIVVRRFAPVKKGMIYFTWNFPYANYLYAKTTTADKHKFGFLGFVPGIDYFYKTNTYLSLQGGIAIDNMIPFPAPVDYFGPHDRMGAMYLNLRHGHVVKSFDFGYGLSYSRYKWYESDYADPNFVYKEKDTRGFGLTLTSQYRLTKNFRLGLLYQPTVLNIENGRLRPDYEHLLSLELVLKFRVSRRRG